MEMEVEEYFFLFGLVLVVFVFIYFGQMLSGEFCEGFYEKFGDYYVSVLGGFLWVLVVSGDVFIVYGQNVILRRVLIEYLYLLDSRCYIVKIRYKGGIFFYVFVGGIVFVGGVFFYMVFLKYC